MSTSTVIWSPAPDWESMHLNTQLRLTLHVQNTSLGNASWLGMLDGLNLQSAHFLKFMILAYCGEEP